MRNKLSEFRTRGFKTVIENGNVRKNHSYMNVQGEAR
jgi:hypothetical protein